MLSTKPRYTLSNNDFFISDEVFVKRFLVHDRWEDFDEAKMERYFKDGYQKFLNRFDELMARNRNLSPEEEKELKFMLESLIEAKNVIHNR